MIGTFFSGIASSTFDSRVAIMTITIVILAEQSWLHELILKRVSE